MSEQLYQLNDKSKDNRNLLSQNIENLKNPIENILTVNSEKKELENLNNSKIQNSSLHISNLKEFEKLTYATSKEKEYLDKIDSLNRVIDIERTNSSNIQRELNEKTKELKEKEKALNTITVTNSKLMVSLENLKKDVDEKLDKVSIKQVSDKMKALKENPLEIVIKVKEKELKNTMNLIEILKKDNENLKKSMNDQININSYIDLQNKLKFKETQNIEFTNEIKTLSRANEEHNKCLDNKKEYENEKKNLKEEIKKQKEFVKDLQQKIREEEIKHTKTKDLFINLKRQTDFINRQFKNNQISENQEDVTKIHNLNHDENVNEILSDLNKNNLNSSLKNNNSDINLKKISILNEPKILSTKKKNLEKAQSREASLNNKLIKRNKLNEETQGKEGLFTSEEKNKLNKLLSSEEIEKFEKKYEVLEQSKQSLENKLKSENKLIQKKFLEKEDQLEYLNLQYKETDQKNKIFQFQINEYKNEQKVFHRKINEMQNSQKNAISLIKEKEQENKILVTQMNNLRKLVKHNAIPALDSEVLKHLEKIKNSNDENFDDEDIKDTNFKDMDKISNLETLSGKNKIKSIKLNQSNILENKNNIENRIDNVNNNEMNNTQNSKINDDINSLPIENKSEYNTNVTNNQYEQSEQN